MCSRSNPDLGQKRRNKPVGGQDFLYAIGLVKGEKGEEKQKTA